MTVSKAQQRAVAKYMKKNYDTINVRMPKGKRHVVKDIAAAQGISVNGFMNRIINDAIAAYKDHE